MKKKINKKLPGFKLGLSALPISIYNVPVNTYNGSIPTGLEALKAMNYEPLKYDPTGNLAMLNGLPQDVRSPFGKFVGSAKNVMSKIGNGALFASGAVSFAGDVMNAFGRVKGTNELLADSGTSNSNVGGFGYTALNDIDQAAQRAELRKENNANTMKTIGSGAALGATFGPIGAGIGAVVGGIAGLFGRSRRKKKLQRQMEIAQNRANNLNVYNRSGAQTQVLQQDYAKEFGDTEDLILFAKDGKDNTQHSTKEMNDLYEVYTSMGKRLGRPNSRVAGLESIIDNIDDVSNATGTVVKDGQVGKDGPLANLGDSTIVLGGLKDWRSGNSFRDEALPYTMALEKINKKFETKPGSILKYRGRLGKRSDELQQLEINKLKQPIVDKLKDLADQLKYQHQIEGEAAMNNFYYAKNGKDALPGFKKGAEGALPRTGWLSNAIPHGIGALSSLYQYFDAKGQKIHKPDIYAENPYEAEALRGLAELRVNPYPILNQLRDAERRADYTLTNSGGLSGALKYLGRIANFNSIQNTIANLLTQLQEKNLGYKQAYRQAQLNAGSQTAQRRQAANQYNEEAYAAAHGARQQGMQMGMRNFLDYLNSYASNEYNRTMGNGMLNLYDQQVKLDKDKTNAYINAMKNNNLNQNNSSFDINNYKYPALSYDLSNYKPFNPLADFKKYERPNLLGHKCGKP